MFKMNKENIEQELKESVKKGQSIANKIVIGAVAAGTVYLVGAYKGANLGHARGYLKGYAKATHDIADMMRQGVSSTKTE
jgi:hypothetical protein